MRIGLFGGSFDPLHNGHIQLATAALRQLKLDKVFFIPARHSPLKTAVPFLSTDERLRLLKKAMKENKNFSLATWELNQPGPSYTVRTLRRYHKKNPTHQLFFIMGSDVFNQFSKWKSPKEVSALATLVVGRRPGSLKIKGRVKVLKGTFPRISSTEIRRNLNMSKARKEHCAQVGLLAGQLAKKWGWNPEKAELAGVLHDVAKEWPFKALFSYVKKEKLKIPNLSFMRRHGPNLLHAYVGADYIKKRKWVTDQDSLNAIRNHTLGDVRMGKPEKILFVADFASPGREFSKSDLVRALAFRNLDLAYWTAVAFKMDYTRSKGKRLHPLTLKVWTTYLRS